MTLEPVLIAGEWRQPVNPSGSFKAIDPTTGKPLPESYPVSVDGRRHRRVPRRRRRGGRAAVDAAGRSHRALPRGLRRAHRGGRRRAGRTRRARDRSAGRAAPAARSSCRARPTSCGRAPPRRAIARGRCATIDTKANLRSYYGPLGGPVVVFGPNNFPFAFNSVAGRRLRRGDRRRQSGHRQGEHRPPGHQPVARRAGARGGARRRTAAGHGAADLPDAARRRFRAGVATRAWPPPASPAARAPASQLKAAADRAGKPIYLEMSSINPVFVLAGRARRAVGRRSPRSCTIRARWARGSSARGPGLAVVPKRRTRATRSSPSWRRCSRRARRARCSAPSGATAIADGAGGADRQRRARRWRAAAPSTASASRSSRRCSSVSARAVPRPTRTRCRPRRSGR